MKVVYLAFFLCLSSILYSQVTFQNAFPNLTFNFPVEIQNTGVPGDDRLFVVEQRGTIKVFDNDANTNTATTFLDIQNDVDFLSGLELGLLGLAFHPNYQQNGFFYVYYTKGLGFFDTPVIIVERIKVNPSNPNLADLSNRLILFQVTKNQSNSNHNGGKITFGSDGYLYISIGDGGGAGDPQNNARNTNSFFGKILRIDVDVDGSNSVDNNGISPNGNYEIPSDNPLVNQSGQDEIYAWGIRNTWKMSFDETTGRLWGGDVGQGDLEEINLIENGENYGWDRFEGTSIEDSSVPDPGNTIFPVFEYNHDNGDVSITGGYVYRGSEISSINPSLFGKYIFGDYVTGRIWAMNYDPSTGNATRENLFQAVGASVSSFGEDIHGELYFTDYGSNGVINKIIDGTTPPNAVVADGVGVWCDDILGTDGTVNALAKDGTGNLYVAGNFAMAGGTSANNIAQWNGSTWMTLSTGANGVINALTLTSNGDLYAGGSFTNIGGTAAKNIAKWNGSIWQALGTGTSGPVAALKVDSDDKVYVGGAFISAGGITCNNIALWDNAWSALTDISNSIAGTTNEIRSIEVDENDVVYVGGNFATAGGNAASRIATWNGSTWGTLGAGTSGFVQAILSTPDYIYTGGNFGLAGGMTVNRIARWNRSTLQWEKLENGLSNSVNTLAEKEGYIYVGGAFSSALNNAPDDNIIVNSIVRWKEGTGWEAMGESTDVGVDNLVNALTFINCKLYVGGNFSMASGNDVDNITCWETVCPPVVEVMGADVTGTFQADSLVFNPDDCIIQSQAEFIAGKLIELKDGFHAQENSEFTARIAPCGSSSPSVLPTENEETIEERGQEMLAENSLAEQQISTFKIFPNPTSEITNFQYELTGTTQVQLSIYDMSGKLVKSILPTQIQDTGQYLVEFSTEKLDGVYLVELRLEERRLIKKLVVLK